MKPDPAVVSVVIPVYNVAGYVDACLDSVVGQTYQHLEVILVDDGSTDGSGRLCDERASREPRIRVIHQTNQGLSHARNVGIAAATGTFITFLDSDDWWHPSFVATLVQAIDDHPGAGTAMCSFTRVPGAAYDPALEQTRLLSPLRPSPSLRGSTTHCSSLRAPSSSDGTSCLPTSFLSDAWPRTPSPPIGCS